MDIDGNDPKQLTKSPNDDFTIPDVTPDGRWVVYRKKGEEKGIWKAPMAGGDPVRLNETGVGMALAVSPDGKMIAYSYDDPRATPRRGVAIMALDGGPPVKLFDISAGPLRWTTDARFLLYTTEGSGSNIWSQPTADCRRRGETNHPFQLSFHPNVRPIKRREAVGRGSLHRE